MYILGHNVTLGMSVSKDTIKDASRMRAIYDAGIRVAEICLFDQRESDAQARKTGGEIYDAVCAAGLRPWSVHLPTGGKNFTIDSLNEADRARSVENMSAVLRMAASWDVRVAVVHGCYIQTDDPALLEACTDACSRSLAELKRNAGPVRVAVENMPRTPLGHSAEIKKTVVHCDGLCFDVNHLLLQEHAEFLDELESYVITTHLSDYDRGGSLGERHWYPGHAGGVVPWREIFERLIGGGYRGPWVFEAGFADHVTEPRHMVDSFINAIAHSKEETA